MSCFNDSYTTYLMMAHRQDMATCIDLNPRSRNTGLPEMDLRINNDALAHGYLCPLLESIAAGTSTRCIIRSPSAFDDFLTDLQGRACSAELLAGRGLRTTALSMNCGQKDNLGRKAVLQADSRVRRRSVSRLERCADAVPQIPAGFQGRKPG
jgi:hypothetical protein